MAIVEMTKLRMMGLKSEQDKVLDVLTRSHVFEPKATAPIEGTGKDSAADKSEEILSKQARLAFAVGVLSDAAAEAARKLKEAKKRKTPPPFDYVPEKTSGRKIITYADFYNCAAKEYELLDVCDRLEKLCFERTELNTSINKLESRKRQLYPYINLPVGFDGAGETRCCTITIAAAAASTRLGPEMFTVPVALEQFPGEGGSCAVVLSLSGDAPSVRATLSEHGFSLPPAFAGDKTPKELIAEADRETALDRARTERIFIEILSYEKYLTELKTLYDFLGTENEKCKACEQFAATGATYVMEGWVPKRYATELVDEVKTKTENIAVWLLEPEEGEVPPTLLDNPKVIKPFESITNMYSPPAYTEKDPNFVMAIFFFIIFGMMMADAGYGLVLSLACTLLIKLTHFERGVKDLAAVFGICGVSTVLWGALFGSWFGLSILPPLWFNPLEEPIMLLAVCLILGIIHMMVGYGYQAYYLIKSGKPLDAICDVGFIYLLVVGIALLALPLVLPALPAVVGDIGLYTLLASLVLIFLTAGRHKKGILGKLGGGVSGLYGLVNLFSDVLSYARIFGIALAGGAIASAFNTILGVLAGSVYMIPVAVILGIALHLFNLAISLLGAYVHNARLQFLEFYGKFYTGDGRLFSPIGERTKYIRFA